MTSYREQKNMKKIVWALICIILAFTYGVSVGALQIFPYDFLQKIYTYIRSPVSDSEEIINLEVCSIPEISEIPYGATVVIGHAYGKFLPNSYYIAKKVEQFLELQRNKIRQVIFTGDVFKEPSIAQWEKLYEQFSASFDVFVAPGNHDIAKLAAADIFALSPFNFRGAKRINSDSAVLIIENSISSNWLINPSTKALLQDNANSSMFLLRHNIPIIELIMFANSIEFKSPNLPTAENFTKQFGELEKLVIISGDSGAKAHLPRQTCHRYQNFTFISNGIGEVIGDRILVIEGETIYSYPLD
jgi:hypothetical protein